MKLSIQTGDIVDRLGFEEGYKQIKECGFDAIDWNLDHAVKPSDIRNGTFLGKSILEKPLEDVIAYYADELSIIRKNDIEITQAHAPFPAWDAAHPETLDYMIEIYKRNIEFCDYAGCRNLVIHGIPLKLTDSHFTPDDIYKLNVKLYTSLIPTLLKCNVIVCLENLFTGAHGINYAGHCGNPIEAASFIDYLNEQAGREVFGFCFDTGHMNLLRQDFRTVLPILGNRIKCFHIHDNDGNRDNHLAPLTSVIDWKYFCQSVKEIGYDYDLSFETFSQTNHVMDFDMDLLIPWMKLIAATGECFKKHIKG